MFAYLIRYLSWNETSFNDKTETVKQPIQRSSDALKWNELDMAAIHTDNIKIIDSLRNQNINPKEDQLPIITGRPHIYKQDKNWM